MPSGVKFHDILYRSLSPHPLHFFEFGGTPGRAERGRECRRTRRHQIDRSPAPASGSNRLGRVPRPGPISRLLPPVPRTLATTARPISVVRAALSDVPRSHSHTPTPAGWDRSAAGSAATRWPGFSSPAPRAGGLGCTPGETGPATPDAVPAAEGRAVAALVPASHETVPPCLASADVALR